MSSLITSISVFQVPSIIAMLETVLNRADLHSMVVEYEALNVIIRYVSGVPILNYKSVNVFLKINTDSIFLYLHYKIYWYRYVLLNDMFSEPLHNPYFCVMLSEQQQKHSEANQK